MKHPPAAIFPPVAVGGVGGSGTRIVARLLRAAGIHTGDDLNPASDTLWFTLLFKRVQVLRCSDAEFDALVRILSHALAGTAGLDASAQALIDSLAHDDRAPQHTAQWLRERAHSLAACRPSPQPRRWGWKEPNTHIVLDRLWQRLPDLRYVHVVRHGVDMAFSANQNQLRLWGPHILGEDGPITPARSLAYWCRVHRRMQQFHAANPGRMYWLDYDALCRSPEAEAAPLCRFLQCDASALAPVLAPVLAEVRAAIVPRHANESLAAFDPDDLEFVRSLGYTIHERP